MKASADNRHVSELWAAARLSGSKHTCDVTFLPVWAVLSHTQAFLSLLDAFSMLCCSCCQEAFFKFEWSNRKLFLFLSLSWNKQHFFQSFPQSGPFQSLTFLCFIWSDMGLFFTGWSADILRAQTVFSVILRPFLKTLCIYSQIKTISIAKFSNISGHYLFKGQPGLRKGTNRQK